MRRRVVLISPKHEMCLPSQSTVPLAADCLAEQTTDCVERGKAHARSSPIGEPLTAQFAQLRFLSENAMSYGHWLEHFRLFHNVAPGRSRRNRSLGAPVRVLTLSDHLPRRPSSPRRGHARVSATGRSPPKNGAEVMVRLGGRGELVEVIRFCGLLLGARA